MGVKVRNPGFTRLGMLSLAFGLFLAVSPNAQAAAKGVNLHCGGMPDQVRIDTFDRLAAAGTRWVRMDAYEGQSAQADLERCAALAHERGMRVLWVMTAAPPWTPTGYAADAASLVATTQADGFEVWNEQNSRTFWTGTVAEWVALVRVTAAAVHAASPSTVVVTGGTSHVALAWLQRAYSAGLAATGYDALAVHPYERGRGVTVKNLKLLRGLRRLQTRYHDRRPVWLTEIGLTTANQTAQAAYLTTTVKDLRAFPFVKAAFWYQATAYGSPNTADQDYALMDANLNGRPAWLAFTRWNAT